MDQTENWKESRIDRKNLMPISMLQILKHFNNKEVEKEQAKFQCHPCLCITYFKNRDKKRDKRQRSKK